MQLAKLAIIHAKHAHNQLLALLADHLSIELSILQLLSVFAIVVISTTITLDNVFRAFQ
jgi:hypothetical protein